jgi:hypothetical protein
MISCVVFSKDRACQLELLLRSIQDNFKELDNVHIICKGTTDEYVAGYLKVANMYQQFKWIPENNLINDVQRVINSFDKKYCMTLVDDEIVIRDHSIEPLITAMETDDDLHGASLRLGKNIGDYCYTADIKATIPNLEQHGKLYKWDWTTGDNRVDWFYPSCINSNIYKTDFLKDWINKITFGNINDLEGTLNSNRSSFKHYMICLEKSKTVNIANNLVQSGYNRHSDKNEFSLEGLNKKFLDGYVIDSTDFYNINNDIATFERDYKLIKW